MTALTSTRAAMQRAQRAAQHYAAVASVPAT
jgi:hypothetical protein